MSELDRNLTVNICKNVTIQDFSLGKWVLGKRSGEQRRAWWTWRLWDVKGLAPSQPGTGGVPMCHSSSSSKLLHHRRDVPAAPPTWVKLSRALCRFACIPVGASLVILIEFSRMPWGMMWLSGEGAGSALMKTRKSWWLLSLCCSSFFSKELSHLATRWMFWQGQRGHSFISPSCWHPH